MQQSNSSRPQPPAQHCRVAAWAQTPLICCHLAPDDQANLCLGFPQPGQWLASPQAATAAAGLFAALLSALVLNGFLLRLVHAGRARLSDVGGICVCMNAAADSALIVCLLVADFVAPLAAPGVQRFSAVSQIAESLGRALLCRFREYAVQSCLTMDLMLVASLARFALQQNYDRILGAGPCGVFIYPSFVALLSLGANVWFLVLFECRLMAYGGSGTPTAQLAVLLSDEPAIAGALFGLSALTQLLPLGCVAGCLCVNWRHSQARGPGAEAARTRQRLRLAACLAAAHCLALPHVLGSAGRFLPSLAADAAAEPSALHIATWTAERLGLAIGLALKPAACLAMLPELRRPLSCRRALSSAGDGGGGRGADANRTPLIETSGGGGGSGGSSGAGGCGGGLAGRLDRGRLAFPSSARLSETSSFSHSFAEYGEQLQAAAPTTL